MSAFLQLESVSKQYDGNDKASLLSIDLEIPKGKIVAVMGASGSGKTTLLRLIAGLEHPSSGIIYFNKEKLLSPKEQLVAGHTSIRLINQNLSLPHSQSIASSISYQLKHHTAAYKESRTQELLAIFELEPHQNKTPNQLSGGQRQRALFAWAIADEPELLLMDEPLSHLDDMFKKYLYNKVFRILKKSKTTVLFATHQAEEVFRLAQEVILLKNGALIQKGTPYKVYSKPNSIVAAQLLGECNVMPKKIFLESIGAKVNPNTKDSEYVLLRPNSIKIASKEKPNSHEVKISKITFMGGHLEVKAKLMPQKTSIKLPELIIHTLDCNHKIGDIINIFFNHDEFISINNNL